MQRKIATLEIWEDDTVNNSGCENTVDGFNGKREPQWEIRFNPKQTYNGRTLNTLTTLAHELGHFLAQLVNTPASRATTNRMVFLNRLGIHGAPLPLVFPKEVYREEKEAWDIARLIYPALREDEATESLATYER